MEAEDAVMRLRARRHWESGRLRSRQAETLRDHRRWSIVLPMHEKKEVNG